ncbi:unnamed protein product [Ectocarpus sp. 12 AP-2014]
MSEIGEEQVCKLACSQTLDGYNPNPFYASGMCPDYMKSECNLGGKLWQNQWDMHKKNIKEFNAERMFHASMGIPTQVVGYGYQPQQPPPLLPPTSSQVFSTMRQMHPQKFQGLNLQPNQFYP